MQILLTINSKHAMPLFYFNNNHKVTFIQITIQRTLQGTMPPTVGNLPHCRKIRKNRVYFTYFKDANGII